jgi:hypothetical protein
MRIHLHADDACAVRRVAAEMLESNDVRQSGQRIAWGTLMKATLFIGTILSLACATVPADHGGIVFTGRVVQPTVDPAVSDQASAREVSPLIASVRVESLANTKRPAMPLLDYFAGYLGADPAALAGASVVEITYQ